MADGERVLASPEEIKKWDDRPQDMTLSRRIALSLMKYPWYYPKSQASRDVVEDEDKKDGAFRSKDGYPAVHTKTEPPSLEKAWAYFDHVALPRYVVEDSKGGQLTKAEPGEDTKETKLYAPFRTPHSQLGDFGIGIGLYFTTLALLFFIMLTAGCIQYGNFRFFYGTDYSKNGQAGQIDWTLYGSAICTDYDYVACPDCEGGEDVQLITLDTDNTTLTFARRMNCEGATYGAGITNFCTIVFVILSLIGLNWYLKKEEVSFDEDEQTTQDYSITIDNPPTDAYDPEVWRKFFEVDLETKVAGITVALDNTRLVKQLVERREAFRKLELSVEPGFLLDMPTLQAAAEEDKASRNWFTKCMAMFSPGVSEHYHTLVKTTEEVKKLLEKDYHVVEVMVTFETEADQRKILKAYDIGRWNVERQKTWALDPKYLFDGHVLGVSEAGEPSTILWDGLDVTMRRKVMQQTATNSIMFLVILLVGWLVEIVKKTSGFELASYLIAVCNTAVPILTKSLVKSMEEHETANSLQASMFVKIALFRIVTSTVLITVLTDFSVDIDDSTDSMVYQVFSQFKAEVTTTAALQLVDIGGNYARHYSAPRSPTMTGMTLFMQGTEFELAERYTSLTKNLFLGVWYCAIFPAGLLWCALSMAVMYVLDRFSLMRSWKRPPALGPEVSEFNRIYSIPMAVAAMAVMSSYFWSAYPFDNICPNPDQQVPAEYVGTFSAQMVVETDFDFETFSEVDTYAPINITVDASDSPYFFCVQDYFRDGQFSFPFVPRFQDNGYVWMTSEQDEVTTLFGWTTVGIVAVFFFALLAATYYHLWGYFKGDYESTGDDKKIDFHNPKNNISLYIPEVDNEVYAYPLLACDCGEMPDEMFGWNDVTRSREYYDLTKDAQALKPDLDPSKPIFSKVVHYPPEKQGSGYGTLNAPSGDPTQGGGFGETDPLIS